LKHIRLYRPATVDLILSKMMRGDDPQHMEEIQWMIAHESISQSELEAAFATAHMPEDLEIAESFEVARAAVLAMF
jgi:hypothetical protein